VDEIETLPAKSNAISAYRKQVRDKYVLTANSNHKGFKIKTEIGVDFGSSMILIIKDFKDITSLLKNDIKIVVFE